MAIRGKQSVQALRVDVYGQMTVINRLGQVYQAHALADSVVHPWCMVLHLQLVPILEEAATSAPRSQRLLLLPDQADRNTLSALRAWLRWGQS